MNCNDVRTFFSQISDKSVSLAVTESDIDFLVSNGYLARKSQAEYDEAHAEVANLQQTLDSLQSEKEQESAAAQTMSEDEEKAHSIRFYFEGKDEKEAQLQKIESEKGSVSKLESDITERESSVSALIQKKSALDTYVSYGTEYLSLTGLGQITLNDLNVYSTRVGDIDFETYIEQSQAVTHELNGIAQRAAFYVSAIEQQLDSRFIATCANCGRKVDVTNVTEFLYCSNCHKFDWVVRGDPSGQFIREVKADMPPPSDDDSNDNDDSDGDEEETWSGD
jgi:hypothetical protein